MMGTIKKPFMPLLCLFMLSLVLIFCWNRLFVKKLYAAPSLSKIAAHWSPYIYQGTKNNYDFITNFNFDGNWNGKDNWENAGKNQYYTNFHAYVYYAIIESDSHYFITYMFFHPRDTGGSGGLGAHENDSEGCRVEILKNGSYWGKILRIGTVAHKNYYYNYNPTLVNGSHPAVYVCEKKHAVYGTNKAKGYDCLYLDIITCRIFPGSEGTGVGYWYAGRGAEIPSNQNDRDVSYELINMESTLWPRRFNSVTFRNCGLFVSGYYNWDEEAQICGALCSEFGSKFRGDNHSSLATRCNAAAPWAYPFELSGFGAWFIDPLMYHCYKHCDGTGEQYVFNPYLGYVINCPASCD